MRSARAPESEDRVWVAFHGDNDEDETANRTPAYYPYYRLAVEASGLVGLAGLVESESGGLPWIAAGP